MCVCVEVNAVGVAAMSNYSEWVRRWEDVDPMEASVSGWILVSYEV